MSITRAIAELTYDECLPDGLMMLSGPSGCGKTVFAEHYANENLQSGGRVLWITTEELPVSLKSAMARFGWDVAKYEMSSRFMMLDAASPARLGFSENLGHGTLGMDPTGMLIAISEQLRRTEPETEKKRLLVVVDSVSRLLLSCDPRSVIDFVSCLSSRMENFKVTGLATISEMAHDEKTLNALIFSCAGTIRFRIKEEGDVRKRQFRLETLRGRKHMDAWRTYQITDSGFEIKL